LTRTHRKNFEGKLGALALTSAQRFLVRKSPERAEVIGERLGRAVYRLSKKHRMRALRNLALAFPNWSAEKREHIARSVLSHFGRVTADFLVSSARTPEMLEASLDVTGIENIDRALEQGKGAILVTGHFGNWERLSAWLSMHGYPLSVIARDVRNAELNKLVNALRSGTGTEVISRGNSTRTILQKLRNNELIGILPDQNSDESFIPFFGHLAGTVLGPGVLSERTGAPVIPTWCVWTSRGRYAMTVEQPLVSEGDGGVKGEGLMRAYNAALERVVTEHPEQWLWIHDRWKSARQRGLL